MKTYNNPTKEQWAELIERPVINQEQLIEAVSTIINDVKQNGDKALIKYASLFDGVELTNLAISEKEIKQACKEVSQELKDAIQIAYNNIYAFHKAQQNQEEVIETVPGVKCWRKSVAIEKVGLYIPGGSAPLFSTILMLGIPALIAGCEEVVLCTPPNKNQEINPAILYTANLVGITKIYKVGGAQAVAAMAYGTENIPQVYKIFGPGNQYVTKAKELVQQSGVAIDMPAGPSEVLVIADDTCKPIFVAADLLSQAEHGADSQVILLSDNENVVKECLTEVNKQVAQLPRKETALKALANSKAIVLKSIEDCISFSNQYAPEHLIIASNNANHFTYSIINAGSVFLGNYSCESAGDYASGTNHTLPTNGFAKNYSGVSLDSFVKKITFQELSKVGINNIGKAIEIMAEAEELIAHKNAVTLRLQEVNND
ncbi:MAG: histidinol dehydrogenase [Flavobacteriales bacterium]|nr:histidinol dehydrogenase [Flavobacteriales bacterium]MCW8913391.1 histidinol dehydrogenase [Flavobacteriales bacterium]MCW8938545.1 histidinol dehydrogenase [Flavobacteriales bacterium]MCW8939692.1 histidinol dehydrogenase [Flavobacteriales bacterium]MCW8969468.1 histidinol dehydrogenase [Flavobacteriales bacterium]